MWDAVLERFAQAAPESVMARVVLEHALPAAWVDQTFDSARKRQYPRALLMSTVIELMLPVVLGLQPSLHAAARQRQHALPVSLVALYDKVKRTEPSFLRALIQGSARRLRIRQRRCLVTGCASSTATICRRARSAARHCGGRWERRCRGMRWWSMIRMPIWWWIWWPVRMPMSASGSGRRYCFSQLLLGGCGWPVGCSAPP